MRVKRARVSDGLRKGGRVDHAELADRLGPRPSTRTSTGSAVRLASQTTRSVALPPRKRRHAPWRATIRASTSLRPRARGETRHDMEGGIDRRTGKRIEIGLRVAAAAVNEPERTGNGAHRNRVQPAVGAGGDITERPCRIEEAALAGILVGEANTPVRGIVSDALAVGIHSRCDGAGADAIGLVADHRSGRGDNRGKGFERLHHRSIVRGMNDRTRGMGHEIEKPRVRPLAIEFSEGGEHAAAELRSGKGRARCGGNLVDRRVLAGALRRAARISGRPRSRRQPSSTSRRARFAAAATGSSDVFASTSSGMTISRTIFAPTASPTCRSVSSSRTGSRPSRASTRQTRNCGLSKRSAPAAARAACTSSTGSATPSSGMAVERS